MLKTLTSRFFAVLGMTALGCLGSPTSRSGLTIAIDPVVAATLQDAAASVTNLPAPD